MPAATPGMIDPDGPWRPSTSQRNANLSSQYYPSHPAPERRPLYAPSRHNEESLDRQAAADQAAYARKGNIYWPHARHHMHHPAVGAGAGGDTSPHDSLQQPWGRAQGHYQDQMGTFNPITGHWSQEPDHPDRAREAFLPGSKAGVHSSQTEAAYGPDSVGKYDPILHKWIVEPDHQKWQAREREHANEVGIKMEGRPWHVHQAQGTYDPITNEWLNAPAGTVAQTAGDRSRQDEHDWAVNKTGRLCVSSNTRLGVYDPIRNIWQVPPSNLEERDEQMRLKAHGHIPIKRKVPTSPNIGVYDPVRQVKLTPLTCNDCIFDASPYTGSYASSAV
ncbi:hypothetical protein ABBQ38_011197 [Trebouxia sp. C0009 RCD-2024]